MNNIESISYSTSSKYITKTSSEEVKSLDIYKNDYSEAERNAIFNVDLYNNYNDWNIVVNRGPAVMANSLGDRIFEDSSKIIQEYFEGEKTAEDVEKFMSKCCDLMIEYQTYVTSENSLSDSDKEEIVGAIYSLFSFRNTVQGVAYCSKLGNELNKQYESNDTNYVYYDADVYYNWKQLSQKLTSSANKVVDDVLGYEINIIKHSKKYPDNGFNLQWNFDAALGKQVASLLDTDIEPPKGFKFLFKDMSRADNMTDGLMIHCPLRIWSGDLVDELTISLSLPKAGDADYLGGFMNLEELQNKYNFSNKEYDFLKNIQVFTRLYGVKNYDSLRNTLKAVQNKHFN